MADISAEQVAAAEQHLLAVKESGTLEDRVAAMQAVNDLRSAYRAQEEAAGRRRPGHTVEVENETGE